MTAAYDKSGQPLNSEAWGKAAYAAFVKAGQVRGSSKDPKEIAAADAEMNRTQAGHAKALADEAAAAKSKPAAAKAQARYGGGAQ